jgi:hypothetical protein
LESKIILKVFGSKKMKEPKQDIKNLPGSPREMDLGFG